MLTDEWFVGLSCTERGFWMQLILLAKAWGDTGVITTRSRTALAQAVGMDGKTCSRFCLRFVRDLRIKVIEHQGKFLSIEIVNYQYYQGLSPKKDGKNGAQKAPSVGENSPLIEEQTRQDKYIGAADAGRSDIFQEVMDYYNLKTKRNWSLTDARKKMLKVRLKTFTVEQLKDAIDGITSRPHNLGQNQTNTVYLDFELIFRNDGQVDKYRQDRVAKKTPAVKYWEPEKPQTPEEQERAEAAKRELLQTAREKGILR